MKITTTLLKAADSSNANAYYDSIVDTMNHYAEVYAINTTLRIAHFLSQIGHESGFKIIEENGSYSPERMRAVFGCKGGMKNYDKTKDDCKLGRLRDKLWSEEAKYAHNAKNLLGYVYALRIGNGDEASGDGYNYRGRGMIQLTGKSNYAKFTTVHNNKNPDDPRDFVAHPDLIVTDTKYGIESAYFFWDSRNINAIADSDDAVKVTIAVNGGTIGLDDRKLRLKKIKTAIGI
jgi:predicted chitinase